MLLVAHTGTSDGRNSSYAMLWYGPMVAVMLALTQVICVYDDVQYGHEP